MPTNATTTDSQRGPRSKPKNPLPELKEGHETINNERTIVVERQRGQRNEKIHADHQTKRMVGEGNGKEPSDQHLRGSNSNQLNSDGREANMVSPKRVGADP